MKNVIRTLLIGTTIALSLAGQAWAQKKVIIGHFGAPSPYYAAVIDGRLEKATGWTIEWRKFNSGAEVNAAMASGGIVLSEIGSVPLSAGTSQGVDYFMFALAKAIVSSESMITRNGAGIEKPLDLKGKKIAVPIGSTAHFSLMGALKTFKLTEKDVQIVGMSPPEIAAAWTQNTIDAAFIWEPVQSKLRENGKRLITAGEIAKAGFPTFNAWVVNTKFAAENRAGLIGFMKVLNEVNGDFLKNKAAWHADSAPVKGIAAMLGATPKDVVGALDGSNYPDSNMQLSADWMGGGAAATMKATAEFLKSVGRLNATADSYAKYVNPEFAKAAAGK